MAEQASIGDASFWTDLSQASPALIAVRRGAAAADHPHEAAPPWVAVMEALSCELPDASQARVLEQHPERLVLGFAEQHHAIGAALQIQRGARAAGLAAPSIGAHLLRDDDARDIADRLAGLAGAGEVLASEALRDRIVAGLDAEIAESAAGAAQGLRAYSIAATAPEPARGSFAEHKPTLVVLPLRVVPGNRCDPVYAELISYGVMRALSQNKAWHLISSLSAEAFRHRRPEPHELQRRLRASHVIAGRLSQEGKLLHAEMELTDTRSGECIWKQSISQPLHLARGGENPFGRAVVAGVAQTLFGQIGDGHRFDAPGHLIDIDSYTLLFSAIALMHRVTGVDFQRSRAILQHLVERHPDTSEPQAWLAKWHVMRVARGNSSDIDADSRAAQAAAARALQGDGERPLALAIDGVVQAFLLQDLDRAEAQLLAAITENPNESLAWLFLSALYAYRDRGAAAADAAGTALLLSPLDPMRYYFDSFAAHAMLAAGRLNEAIVLAARSMSANGRHLPTLRTLAIARALNGQLAQAREAVGALLRLDPHYSLARFNTRYPGHGTAFAVRCADALREAGLPVTGPP